MIFLFFLAAVFLAWFWTQPKLAEIDGFTAKKNSIEKALNDSRELQTIKNNLLERFGVISPEDRERIDKVLPDDPEVTKLLVEINNIAAVSGVVIKSFDAQEPQTSLVNAPKSGGMTEGPKYEQSRLTFKVSASYESFKSFLKQLQSSLRLIDINNIGFSSDEKNLYEFSIDALTYSKVKK